LKNLSDPKESCKSQQIWKTARETSIVIKPLTHNINHTPVTPKPQRHHQNHPTSNQARKHQNIATQTKLENNDTHITRQKQHLKY
jgi:hypothetical protein